MHIVATLVASFIVVYFSLLWFRNLLLKKSDWTSDIWIVEVSNKGLLLLWLVYFSVRLVRVADEGIFDNLEQRALAVLNYLKTVIGVSSFWRPVDVLLGLTVTWGIYNLFYIFIKKQTQYDSLWLKDFPEYNFPFQQNLVTFLNEKPRFGHNIYWLDGEWGTGKTHFLRTFFKEQKYKKLELYYVSCFGLTSRDQAEQVLIREIEERSSLGSLDHIPVISNLIKWGFKTLGLDLMKKDSVVIFDDLERAAYSEKGDDSPQDYNVLLGFIDYLANHKNQKVIVVYNSKEMKETYKKIINQKFSPRKNKIYVDKVIRTLMSNLDSDAQISKTLPRTLWSIYGYNEEVNLRIFIDIIKNDGKFLRKNPESPIISDILISRYIMRIEDSISEDYAYGCHDLQFIINLFSIDGNLSRNYNFNFPTTEEVFQFPIYFCDDIRYINEKQDELIKFETLLVKLSNPKFASDVSRVPIKNLPQSFEKLIAKMTAPKFNSDESSDLINQLGQKIRELDKKKITKMHIQYIVHFNKCRQFNESDLNDMLTTYINTNRDGISKLLLDFPNHKPVDWEQWKKFFIDQNLSDSEEILDIENRVFW